jgi:hypothetical protein
MRTVEKSRIACKKLVSLAGGDPLRHYDSSLSDEDALRNDIFSELEGEYGERVERLSVRDLQTDVDYLG